VEHFLLQCPSSDLCRAMLIARKQMKITPTIGNVFVDDKIDVIFPEKYTYDLTLY